MKFFTSKSGPRCEQCLCPRFKRVEGIGNFDDLRWAGSTVFMVVRHQTLSVVIARCQSVSHLGCSKHFHSFETRRQTLGAPPHAHGHAAAPHLKCGIMRGNGPLPPPQLGGIPRKPRCDSFPAYSGRRFARIWKTISTPSKAETAISARPY